MRCPFYFVSLPSLHDIQLGSFDKFFAPDGQSALLFFYQTEVLSTDDEKCM